MESVIQIQILLKINFFVLRIKSIEIYIRMKANVWWVG